MKILFKPGGYNSVSPYFVVENAQQLIDFIKKIFDGEELRHYRDSEGKTVHAEVKLDDSVIMMADANENYPPLKTLVHVYVRDVDEIFQKAMTAGCKSLGDPKQNENDPDRRGTFEDPFGNIWSIGMQVM